MAHLRSTKYSVAVMRCLEQDGHATNAELLDRLRQTSASVSATTVHRVTARLADAGLITYAPNASDGSRRFDSNTRDHDHFVCSGCDQVRDLDVSSAVKPLIENALDGCRINGRLVLHGICAKCASATN
jgi:Fe2+ or Zn2+ uptake regulation protein